MVRLTRRSSTLSTTKAFIRSTGLSQPDLVILIIAKHFSYAGKEEFNFAMAEHEYNRFARTELAASGRTKWSGTMLQAVSPGRAVPQLWPTR
jgi:origin recognition complex subunit 4